MTRIPATRTAFAWSMSLAALLVIIDQASKYAASALDYAVPQTVFPGLDLLLVHNRGAAFSFLDGAGGWQRWLLSVIAIGASGFVTAWLWRLPQGQRLMGAALAFILGGALGNLIDRVALGYVIDFISVYHGDWRFATFNIADVSLNVGAALIVLDVLRGKVADA
jgi:signal peptidase II